MKQHYKQWRECDESTNRWCKEAKFSEICSNPKKWYDAQVFDYIVDPHECQESCNEPSKDCETCTNTEDFFICQKSGYCVHKNVRCDLHVNCQFGEDEDDCAREYVERKVFKSFATHNCQSSMYPGR